MKISFDLTVLGHLLGTLGVRLEFDKEDGSGLVLEPPKALDAVSDFFARRWFSRHS